MKKSFIIGVLVGIFLVIPLIVFSAPSIASRLQGRILLAVEDKGKTYYVAPDGNRYRITAATAHTIFEKLALGITNKDLEDIPLKDVGVDPEARVAGDAVQVVEKIVYRDKIVYVDKPAQCEPQHDSTFYINQIEQLQREVASLKEQNQSLPIVAPDSKAEKRDALNKEYGLKINDRRARLLKAQYRLEHIEEIITETEGPNWRNQNPQAKIDSYKRPVINEIEILNHDILLFQNELERKLLELE